MVYVIAVYLFKNLNAILPLSISDWLCSVTQSKPRQWLDARLDCIYFGHKCHQNLQSDMALAKNKMFARIITFSNKIAFAKNSAF